MEFHLDAAHRDTLRAALRAFEDKLVEVIASRQAAQDQEWRGMLCADRDRCRAMIRELDKGR